ncbi:MAG: AAA family ATPase [Caldilineaceae bacterium]|nr:AAA family ATPase [Caldilineaceae bacterium]
MPAVSSLTPEALYNRCDVTTLGFDTTNEVIKSGVTEGNEFIGQHRAIHAIEFAIGMSRQGYNLFALGTSGTGKHTLVQRAVEAQAAKESPPDDWCYVNNFEQPYRPVALRLPTGRGRALRDDVQRLVEDLHNALSSAFESEEYQTRRQTLEMELQEAQQEQLNKLQEQARERGLTLLRTPGGLVFAPYKDGEVLAPEAFEQLPEDEQTRLKAEVEVLQEQLQKVLYQMPKLERDIRNRLRELNQEVSGFVLDELMNDYYEKYATLPAVVDFFKAIQADVSENLADFLNAKAKAEGQGENAPPQQSPLPNGAATSPLLRRYSVNLLVDSSADEGVPVIYESNPSYLNLVGRVEQMATMGALITDFTLIKPGVLHRANGGYVIIDADKVLTSPYAWDGLKRALQFQEIRIESPMQMMSLTTTVSLEPEPIPLDVKVVLIGDRRLYYLLSQFDPDFNELFKVAADFGDELVRNRTTEQQYARLLATIAQREELQPFDSSAVARIIEQSSRMAGDAERLTARIQAIVDLMEEAEYWAKQENEEIIRAQHVQQAIDGQIYRANRIQERMREQILRETVLIDTAGEKVGQINGLSVIQVGNYAYGQPTRITVNVHMGKGDVLNIEREVEMSGPIHSKGVLILTGLLRARYAQERPLSLSASIVFEQSYAGIEGDSASSTEFYALLSAIGEVPIKQSLAVTGSVNQHGEVQAIGGVNEKIEGFFDVCRERGLTGEQGVLIPVANVKHLMLRQDVVDAAAAGQFHIYPITTVEEGIELLTGLPAGERDAEGNYPEGTVNNLVAKRLVTFADKQMALEKAARGQETEEKSGE